MIVIYILITLTTLVCASAFILPALQAKKANLITNGTIVSIRHQRTRMDNDRNYIDLYFPTFKFTVDGTEYVKESASATSENIYKEGQVVQVTYYKENPMDAILLSDKKRKNVIGIGLTIFAILAGLAVLLSSIGNTRGMPSPSYILIVVAFIVLIVCYFIAKK